MVANAEPILQVAGPDDVAGICRFGEEHIRAHYAPLIGVSAANDQVRNWWNNAQIGAAVASGYVVVAKAGRNVIGIGQRGRRGSEHVVYKLYVRPDHRDRGLGVRLLDAIIEQLPPETDRLYVEHFAANERAGAFYEREGFAVERIEPSLTGDAALAIVWRARQLATSG